MSKTLVMRPKLSEKTYSLSDSRVYVVEIDKSINKHTVARAVKDQFEVEVASVNIANVKGKPKQVRSLSGKRYRNVSGKRKNTKKAYITLKPGFSLPFFTAIEEEQAKAETTQKEFDKAIAKQNTKAEKKGRFSRTKRTKAEDTKEEKK